MQISNKCYYALRALFELSLYQGVDRPVKIAHVAGRQRIPKRFLEVILSELRQGGFVESRRGVEGGYILSRRPEEITIGDIVRFIDREIAPVACVSESSRDAKCEFSLECPFYEFWLSVKQAMDTVYNGTTMADIVERWQDISAKDSLYYEI